MAMSRREIRSEIARAAWIAAASLALSLLAGDWACLNVAGGYLIVRSLLLASAARRSRERGG